MPSSDGSRRVRVERGIYRQTNGRYAVCVMVDGQPRFRTLNAATLGEVRIQRELLQNVARIGELPGLAAAHLRGGGRALVGRVRGQGRSGPASTSAPSARSRREHI